MQLFSRKKSDAEFIEELREKVERPNWGAIFRYGMFVFFLLAFGAIWGMAISLKDIFPEQHVEMHLGFFVGIILGCFAGLMLTFASLSIYWGSRERSVRRAERLLVQTHDRLERLNCQSSSDGNAREPPGDSQT